MEFRETKYFSKSPWCASVYGHPGWPERKTGGSQNELSLKYH